MNRTDTRLSTVDPGRMLQGNWPAAGFQTTQAVGNSSWSGSRLDTPEKVRQYIESRTADLPPTAASLEQLAKEVTERGGTIAIATHAGGTLQSDDAIILENGATIDLIGSVGGPDAKWQWLHHGESYGATYEPDRRVVDPATGEMKTFAEFLTERGKPVPPYIPLIDDGSGGAGGGIDHMAGWAVDADKTKKREDQDAQGAQPAKTYKPMPGFDTAKLNDANEKSPMYAFARWMQDNNMLPSLESLQAFVKANPDWEMNGDQIRIKPEALHKYPDNQEAGQWHRAITNDANGPAWSFTKVEEATTSPAIVKNNLTFDPASRRDRIRV